MKKNKQTKNRNENRDKFATVVEIKKVTEEYYNQFYANKF